jgi:hypothetical protein
MHFFECVRGFCAHMLSKHRTCRCIVAVGAVLLATLSMTTKVSAQVVELRVSTGGLATPSGPDPGNSWTNAYRYLRDAIDFADFLIDEELTSEVEIWVRAGTYYPDENATNPASTGGTNARADTFSLRNDVRIYGGFAGPIGGSGGETLKNQRNPAVNITILSGDLLQNDTSTLSTRDDNAYHVVTGELVGDTAVIDGFTIRAGNAQQVGSVPVPVPACSGMDCPNTGTGCDFNLDSGEVGGGLFLYGVPTHQECGACAPLVMRYKFEGSRAKAGGGVFYSGNQLAGPIFGNCEFLANVATGEQDPNIPSGGGGARIAHSGAQLGVPTFVNCLFVGNSAIIGGGAVAVGLAGSVNLYNCTIANNESPEDDGGAGVEHFEECSPPQEGSVEMHNCIVSGQDSPQLLGSIKAGHCCVTDLDEICVQVSGTNFVDDPDFVGSGNYRLLSTSPCIDEGINGRVEGLEDPGDIDQDGEVEDLIPDLAGLLRIISPGSATGCVVDIGAYEFQFCVGDVDGDCDVDVDDLIAVILQWGCPNPPCSADVEPACGDNDVDVDDLIAIILRWSSPCTGCLPTGTGLGADPESYEDCENICEEMEGEAWFQCMQACFMELCNKGHTEFCD